MTKEKFALLVKGMKSIWTDPKFIPDDFAISMWYAILGDLEYDVASEALKRYMMSSRFQPMPSDIRDMANKLREENKENPLEAWALVMKAIRNSTYNSEEEYKKLPPIVRDAVGSAGTLREWAMSDDFNESVAQSQFIKVYNASITRQENEEKLPPSMRHNYIETEAPMQIEQKKSWNEQYEQIRAQYLRGEVV